MLHSQPMCRFAIALLFISAIFAQGANGATIATTQTAFLSATTNAFGAGSAADQTTLQFDLFNPLVGTLNSISITASIISPELSGTATYDQPGYTLKHSAVAEVKVHVDELTSGTIVSLGNLADGGSCATPCTVGLFNAAPSTPFFDVTTTQPAELALLTGDGTFG